MEWGYSAVDHSVQTHQDPGCPQGSPLLAMRTPHIPPMSVPMKKQKNSLPLCT